MEQLNGKDFHWAIGQIRLLKTMSDQGKVKSPKATPSDKCLKGLDKLSHVLIKQLGILRATGTVRLMKILLRERDASKLSYEGFSSKLGALTSMLSEELGDTYLFSLGDKAEYFNPKAPLFGKEVELQFPVIISEISESGKCYALGRATASAFHSIRCLEAGIRALSRCLGIPDPTRASGRSWQKLLDAIKQEIDCRWKPGSNDRLTGDGQFFEDAYAALAAMQNPWRNATMHFDHTYPEEEAKNVFDVIKGFMMRIAKRVNENGHPLA